jgi:phosphatidylserine/phosphatidylglycerophosphate/cardiolipin synthase-like enzyme
MASRDPSSPPSVRAGLVWGQGHYDEVVRRVLGAKTSVWIATANLKELYVEPHGRRGRYHSVLVELDRLASMGVELRVLHAGVPSGPFREEFDRWPRLVQGGLALRQCPRVHLKVVVVDGAWMYLGSANWTGAGLGAKGEDRRNFELGVATTDERWLDDVQQHFDDIWRGRPCAGCRVRDVCEAPLDVTTRTRTRPTAGPIVKIGAPRAPTTASKTPRAPTTASKTPRAPATASKSPRASVRPRPARVRRRGGADETRG